MPVADPEYLNRIFQHILVYITMLKNASAAEKR
jgi:hypothetical protein